MRNRGGLMYDDEYEEKIEKDIGKDKLYIVKVFKQYGVLYALLGICFLLGNVMVLLPWCVYWGLKWFTWLFKLLSGGNQDLYYMCWIILVGSTAVVIEIFSIEKILDKIEQRKKTKPCK